MKYRILFSVFLVFLLISCKDNITNSVENGEISGQIIDAVDLTPIKGVMITTEPVSNSIMNNDDGTFSISDLVEGNYTVYAEKYGYNKSFTRVKVKYGIIAKATIQMTAFSLSNNPPENLKLLSPANNTETSNTYMTFSWSCSDPDNDKLSYTLLFSETNPPATSVIENTSSTQYTAYNLDTGKTYYWQVIAKDKYAAIQSDIYKFEVKSPEPSNIEDNLILYYSFDNNNAVDESGNGNDGILKNNPTFVSGKIGKACKLTGTSDKLGTGSHILLPKINFKNLSEFTIALWVKEETLNLFNGEAYINWGNASSGWVGISTFAPPPGQDTPTYNFSVGCEFGNSYERQEPVFSEYNSAQAKNWMHFALVYENQTVTAYLNGVKVGSATNTIETIEDYGAIGKHWWTYIGVGSSTSLTFQVDDVRVYNNALNDDEIKTLAK